MADLGHALPSSQAKKANSDKGRPERALGDDSASALVLLVVAEQILEDIAAARSDRSLGLLLRDGQRSFLVRRERAGAPMATGRRAQCRSRIGHLGAVSPGETPDLLIDVVLASGCWISGHAFAAAARGGNRDDRRNRNPGSRRGAAAGRAFRGAISTIPEPRIGVRSLVAVTKRAKIESCRLLW